MRIELKLVRAFATRRGGCRRTSPGFRAKGLGLRSFTLLGYTMAVYALRLEALALRVHVPMDPYGK